MHLLPPHYHHHHPHALLPPRLPPQGGGAGGGVANCNGRPTVLLETRMLTRSEDLYLYFKYFYHHASWLMKQPTTGAKNKQARSLAMLGRRRSAQPARSRTSQPSQQPATHVLRATSNNHHQQPRPSARRPSERARGRTRSARGGGGWGCVGVAAGCVAGGAWRARS